MTIENIDPGTLKNWLEANAAVVVDVREPYEFEAAHIEGAALVPLGRLRRTALPEHSGRKLVVMCQVGGRGRTACQKLRAEMSAHETIYHLEGGLVAWKREGLPVATVERRARPEASDRPTAAPSHTGGFFGRWFPRPA